MASDVEVIRRVSGGPSDRDVRAAVHLARRAAGRGTAAVSVTFVGDATMRALNRRTRKKDKTTDVLAFPASDRKNPAFPGLTRAVGDILGDVVISLPEARRQAKERDMNVSAVVVELLIHGVLHCAGYDHERPRDARVMFPLQERLTRRMIRGRSI